MATIKLKRGLESKLTTVTLQEGEPVVTLDTGKLYVGTTGGTKKLINSVESVNGKTGAITISSEDLGVQAMINSSTLDGGTF